MSSTIGSAFRKFVCASVATVMTAGLAWMVVVSTTMDPRFEAAATQLAQSGDRTPA